MCRYSCIVPVKERFEQNKMFSSKTIPLLFLESSTIFETDPCTPLESPSDKTNVCPTCFSLYIFHRRIAGTKEPIIQAETNFGE